MVEGDSYQQPQRGDLCRINAIGRLENGTVVDELKNQLVQVGDVEVVQGLDMAIPLMRVGEKAEVTCDPRFAYGAHGLENKDDPSKNIPAGAKVCYFNHQHRIITIQRNVFRSSTKSRCSKPTKRKTWKQNRTLSENTLGEF